MSVIKYKFLFFFLFIPFACADNYKSVELDKLFKKPLQNFQRFNFSDLERQETRSLSHSSKITWYPSTSAHIYESSDLFQEAAHNVMTIVVRIQ